MYTLRKIGRKAYVSLATMLAFAATVAPALIRADVEPHETAPTSAAASTIPLKAPKFTPIPAAVPVTLKMKVTAYSSSADETDDTPFITASGSKTRDGVAASNAFPFGTKFKIPKLFGEKIFTVEDRMAPRMKNIVDIWMPSKRAALRFGTTNAEIVIVESVAKAATKAVKEISKL